MATIENIQGRWFAAFLLLGVFAVLFTFPIGDGDFFWHVKTGQWIWENKALPSADPFSYTVKDVNPFRPDSNRIPFLLKQYWLGQLALAGIWNMGGEAGMVAFRAAIYTGILAFLFWWGCRLKRGIWPLIILFLAGNVLRNYPNERPQIFAFVFMPLMLWLLERLRTGTEHRLKVAILLPAVMLLWSNCHGSFILGQVVLVLYAAGMLGDTALGKASSFEKFPLVPLLAALIAPLLNPNGLRAFTEFFNLSTAYKSQVTEYVSPLALAWRSHLFDYWFWALLLLALGTVILNVRRMALPHLLVIIALLGISMSGVRYIPFFVLAAPLLIPYLPDWQPQRRLALIPLAVAAIWAATADYRNVFKFRAERSFPAQAVKFLEEAKPAGRIFNYIAWGGYLMCHSGYPVFVDGRALAEEFVTLHDRVLFGVGWQKVLDDYNINLMLLPGTQPIDGSAYPLLLQLLDAPEWALIHADDTALAFARQVPENKAIIDRYAVSKGRISQHIKDRWGWQFTYDL
ncbi:hypothetical protein [Geobacter sp. DSM 9736]|uniref:hypothetical protein n=1 Tax=Geobacter sp. DSM 9736 TaxID=1277350 RepID=UPI000B50C32C|nr:hypothetical protein [Geobacter sp. DSM 9736]SNB46654.1 hypothetical protein SAMN06269301_2122 [Geobacter sp. DSM 9736]